ncbi:desulfoferrodoxin [Methanobacterium subterraneum]|uniref:Desulfoferrodoxin n=1 Tax=Methanobacterium subterraneum TaxID=59277 RepID=A0A2H4VDF5_9EURY|nr:desulfoferrodoxin [Methanobacterium subterraneum]AUB56138.1 desulfoferrodoxin [Methanobacterium subterraneum]
MTEKGQVYRCDVCGNIVNILCEGQGNLVCCEVPMELLKERQDEDGSLKHRPVIEKTTEGVRVKVGEAAHPMEENHHIELVELTTGKHVFIQFLNPGDQPEAEFPVESDEGLQARCYCNIHGLWKS